MPRRRRKPDLKLKSKRKRGKPASGRATRADSPSAMKHFDRKFGAEFLRGLPTTPAVYRIHDAEGRLIYVGKAKNLRRRLGQYRNARRRKKHFKMRAIVAEAARIEHTPCASDLEACLLEASLIQRERPKWNVAGAFSFMYPLVGFRRDGEPGTVTFCFTTEPELCAGFELHGAFRSRGTAGECWFALVRLLSFVAHRVPRRPDESLGRHTYLASFRRFPEEWYAGWIAFCRGESKAVVEELVLALADVSGARRKPREIQKDLNLLRRFWNHEALPLARAIRWAGSEAKYPLAQAERDFLFLKYRYRKEAGAPAPTPAGEARRSVGPVQEA